MRRLTLALLAALAVATPALGDEISKKRQVDSRLESLHSRLASNKQREQTLSNQVSSFTARIRSLEAKVGDVSLRLSTIEQDLSLHQRRLSALSALYALQTQRLRFLGGQYGAALKTLERRLVAIYESDQATTLDIVLGARSVQDAIEQVQYLAAIGQQDRRIVTGVARARGRVRAARLTTQRLRSTVQGETAAVAVRAQQARSIRDQLVGARNDLSSSRQTKLVALSQLSAADRAAASEIDALQAASAALAVRIRAAQAHNDSGPPAAGAPAATPSSAGLIWPVSGPITSPFGWRWGRLHPGIDIGVPTGTPIHAAAAGTVIYCGWEQGYGNFVVLDNGGDLATAYAHQSAIAVTCGQRVD